MKRRRRRSSARCRDTWSNDRSNSWPRVTWMVVCVPWMTCAQARSGERSVRRDRVPKNLQARRSRSWLRPYRNKTHVGLLAELAQLLLEVALVLRHISATGSQNPQRRQRRRLVSPHVRPPPACVRRLARRQIAYSASDGRRGSCHVVVRELWSTKYGRPFAVRRISHPDGIGPSSGRSADVPVTLDAPRPRG